MLVRCPAKINPFLSVGPLEASGYHPVRTVLQCVGLFDELTIEPAGQDSVTCDWSELPQDNTMTKALRFLRELIKVPPLKIVLEKRIPAQAGLGGGSSDAAGLIRGVKAMLPDQVTDQFAHEVATTVGSDVPFFLVGGRARATGRGQIVEPLPDAERAWLVIVKPADAVSTGLAYARLDSVQRDWREFQDQPYNDFERVAPCVCGEISERLLTVGAEHALLCGSGSAVYGSFAQEADARGAEARISEMAVGKVWTVPTLSREESLWMS